MFFFVFYKDILGFQLKKEKKSAFLLNLTTYKMSQPARNYNLTPIMCAYNINKIY